MRLPMVGRSTQALIAANVVFVALISLQVLVPAAPSASASETSLTNEREMPEFGDSSLSLPTLSALGEMLDRPVFYADRKMPEPPQEEAPPPPKPLMLRLQGVALAGGSRVAVLRNTRNNFLLQLAEGEEHDGWTLDEVTSSSARFSRGKQVTELPLDQETGNTRRR